MIPEVETTKSYTQKTVAPSCILSTPFSLHSLYPLKEQLHYFLVYPFLDFFLKDKLSYIRNSILYVFHLPNIISRNHSISVHGDLTHFSSYSCIVSTPFYIYVP